MIPFNKTKVVATLGPASSSREILRQMILAGVDVCRLNLSHGEYSIHEKIIQHIRSINHELHCHTAILIDLQGPKLRIGEVENNEIYLQADNEVELTTHECLGNESKLFINYLQFPKDVAIG